MFLCKLLLLGHGVTSLLHLGLHEELDNAIVRPGPRGFMAVTANQITGDVLLSLPEVDILDPNDPNIYPAQMCNEKLKALG